MEAAGIADFCNAFACIFQEAAGLEDADAVQMVHDGAFGGGAEQAAEMVFCDVKMIRDVIQGSDGAVILVDIGDKLGNERRTGVFRFLFCTCGLAVGVGKQGKDSDKGRVGAVKIIFC